MLTRCCSSCTVITAAYNQDQSLFVHEVNKRNEVYKKV